MKVRLRINSIILTDHYGRPIEYTIKEAKNAIREYQKAILKSTASGVTADICDVLFPTPNNNTLTLRGEEFLNMKNIIVDTKEKEYSYEGKLIEDLPKFFKEMKLIPDECKRIKELDRGEWFELYGQPIRREK